MSSLAPGVLIELMRLASPALPVGGFSYSEALEAAVDRGLVSDAETSPRVAARPAAPEPRALRPAAAGRRPMTHGARRLRAGRRTERAGPRPCAKPASCNCKRSRWAARWSTGCAGVDIDTMRASSTRQRCSRRRCGRWSLRWQPSAAGAPVHESLISFALGWAENMVQAAIKTVPLGQSAGQRLLDALVAAMPQAVDAAIALPPEPAPGVCADAGHPVGAP